MPKLTTSRTSIKSIQLLTDSGTTDICRICLKPPTSGFSVTQDTKDKFQYLFPSFNFDIYPNQRICVFCSVLLSESAELKRTITESQRILEQYVRAPPSGDAINVVIVPSDLKENVITLLSEVVPSSTNHEPVLAQNDAPAVTPTNQNEASLIDQFKNEDDSFSDDTRKDAYLSMNDNNVDQPRNECELCGQIYPTKKGLKKHVLFMHSEQVPCDVCQKSVRTEYFRAHLRSHPKEERPPPKCSVCNKRFIANYYLSFHMIKHIEDNWRCRYCDDVLNNSDDLKEHVRREHKNAKKYRCSHCGRTFWNPIRLKDHCNMWHKEYPTIYRCEICCGSFIRQRTFKEHVIQKHSL